MNNTKKKATIWLCIAIGLMLLSMIVVSVIQTDGGKVTIKELYWETKEGIAISANLYVPENATIENPAPAVVTSHGAFNNKEMQDANFVELARRGYVVLSVDQPQHGDSDIGGTNGTPFTAYSSVYKGAELLSTLPYVDVSRIGVTGHSMGGASSNSAVVSDNASDTQIISAVLLNSADATYTDRETKEFVNIYGSRDVGIISCVYDEFFHTSTDENGNKLDSPYYMETANAQSFLNFGIDPTGLDPRSAFTIYSKQIDGKETIRVTYRPKIIHPWSHFSTQSTAHTIEFFEKTLGAPNPLPQTNQVWPVKEAFNFVGMIGFFIFITSFAILMLYTPFFATLRSEEIAEPMSVDKKGKLWFWGSMVAGAVFGSVVYLTVITKTIQAKVPQTEPFAIACWAASCGLFSILSMFLYYKFYGKANGVDLAQRGVKITMPKLGKTALLAIIVASVSYTWVFFADYFFKTDFRIWTLAFKTFNANLLFVSIPALLLLLVYFVATSVSINSFNDNVIGKKSNWLIIALFVTAPAIILLSMQYFTYFTTNHMFFEWKTVIYPMYILWLFPFLVVLPVFTAISRVVYKVSKNPYLVGIIYAIIIFLFAVMNTSTKIL